MSNGNLIVHCGARHVELDELAKVPAPPPTDTWFPLKHIDVLNRVVGHRGSLADEVRLSL